MVVKEFGNQVGTLQLTPYQQRLAQHLFISVDTSLKRLEADRQSKNGSKTPIVWNNVNMEKLAIDAVHRIELGLDALIPNHMHVIPYLSGKTGKYDLDLRVGYVGKDYYHRKMAIEPPLDIVYELVYEKDHFKPIKKTAANKVESYEFDITDPFDRGAVKGGFGYIMFEDATKNKLILVSKADFDKSKKKAQSDKFWSSYPVEMMFKTLVHRVTSKLNIDPEKVNASFMQVEMDDNQREIDEEANKGPIIDIDTKTGEVITEAEKKFGNMDQETFEKEIKPMVDNDSPPPPGKQPNGIKDVLMTEKGFSDADVEGFEKWCRSNTKRHIRENLDLYVSEFIEASYKEKAGSGEKLEMGF